MGEGEAEIIEASERASERVSERASERERERERIKDSDDAVTLALSNIKTSNTRRERKFKDPSSPPPHTQQENKPKNL